MVYSSHQSVSLIQPNDKQPSGLMKSSRSPSVGVSSLNRHLLRWRSGVVPFIFPPHRSKLKQAQGASSSSSVIEDTQTSAQKRLQSSRPSPKTTPQLAAHAGEQTVPPRRFLPTSSSPARVDGRLRDGAGDDQLPGHGDGLEGARRRRDRGPPLRGSQVRRIHRVRGRVLPAGEWGSGVGGSVPVPVPVPCQGRAARAVEGRCRARALDRLVGSECRVIWY